ncbi:SGNH/GDSL hydrolase family protein [Foetidibacter luteolus]|uniref:SGNH/GDSL hydrolase family protein n=1 Tax=Foetidibacter luteolus TaxID=2608880 RepID=UPI00129B3F04|nr:SGNH/GDSL hydrolase family protein [Foetidibacter luteolus]
MKRFAGISSLLVLLLLAAAHGCKKAAAPQIGSNPPGADTSLVEDTASYSFLALGDSYTIGASVLPAERFPAQTVELLSSIGKKVGALQYIATSGWTTSNLIAAINQQNPKGPFDIVTLLIGVNDQYQSRDSTGYRERFTQVLNMAISLAGDRSHVFVLSIPDYSVTPFAAGSDKPAIREQIDWFNSINLQVCNAYGISYSDITGISREAANDMSLLANDGLHPSGKMYLKWAQLLAPKIKGVLK